MPIHLSPGQEHRIAEALRTGANHSAADVIDRALEVLHERDEWLAANRQAITRRFTRASKNWNVAKAFPKTRLKLIWNG